MNQYTNQNQMNMAQGGGQGGMRLGAHEFLETQEALRAKTAEIEMFGMFAAQARDPHLRDLMENQQRRILQAYQTLVGMMNSQGQGMNAQMMSPQLQQQMAQMNMNNQARIGLNNPQMPQPNPNATTMSDFAIATIALNWHKMGSVTAMMWANECVNPQLRIFHVNSANNCQQMAYECFQFLNAMGLYQVPQLADHTMQTMMGAVQNQGMGGGQQAMQLGAMGMQGQRTQSGMMR